jgi:formylmethanofuran dehydrogenase subunit E
MTRECDKCGEYHSDLGYTEIDGLCLCNDCFDEYEFKQKQKYFSS